MRHTLPLAMLVAIACQDGGPDTGTEGDGPIHIRTFNLAASSLLLSVHGGVGVMAAEGTVSSFDTTSGATLASTPAGDFAEPAVEDWVGERVAIVDRSSGGGVFIWTPGETGYEERVDDEASASASMARGWDGGLAWVGRRGDTCRFLRDGLPTITLEACGYLRDMATIPADGTLFLGRDDDGGGLGILRLDPNGAMLSIDGPIGLLSWDDALQTLYAADPGHTQVHALTTAGGPVFSLTLEAPILDLAALDGAGALAVLAGEGDQVRVHLIDAIRAEELTSVEAGPSARSLAASADGSTLAIVLPDRLVLVAVDWVALREDTAG